MKIAVVWNHDSRLLDCSFRFEQYVAGFRALGHDPVVVATRESAEGFDAPLHLADDATAFHEVGFWRQIAADVAVIVTWHRMSEVLEVIHRAGTRVAAISDTDGRVGVRVFPGFAFERLIVYCDGWVERAKCVKYWLGRFLHELRTRGPEDDEAVLSTRASDLVALGHSEGLRHFRRFLSHHGEGALASRLVEVPFTIGAAFFSCPVPEEKDDRVCAIGRWGDPQKNALLLAAALELFLAERPQTEIEIFGTGGERVFAPLVARFPGFHYRGLSPQDVVAETLSRCRSIVFSSRWEGCPHAATEALALGATIIGTSIPSLASWTADGRFGRVAGPRPRDLAQALALEMASWDNGIRDGRVIAEHWRPQLAPEAVCRRLLEPVESYMTALHDTV